MPQHQSSTRTHGSTDGTTVTSIDVALGSPGVGEWMVMTALAVNGGTARTFGTPAGWTVLQAPFNNGDFAASAAVYIRQAGVAEPATVALGVTEAGGVTAIVSVVSETNGPNVSDISAIDSIAATIVAPSIAAAAGDLVIEHALAAGFSGSGLDWTIPTDNSETQPAQGGAIGENSANGESAIFTATGATVAATWTNAASGQHKVAFIIAFAPEAVVEDLIPEELARPITVLRR